MTPEYTAAARERLGDDITLAIDQLVVVESDPERARTLARQPLGFLANDAAVPGQLPALGLHRRRDRDAAPTVSSTRSCRGATPIPSPRRSPRTTQRAPITSRSAWSAGRTRCPSNRWRRWYLRWNARSAAESGEEARPARRSWVGGNPRVDAPALPCDRSATDGPAPPARRCPPKPMCNIGIHGASTPGQLALAVTGPPTPTS